MSQGVGDEGGDGWMEGGKSSINIIDVPSSHGIDHKPGGNSRVQ